MRLACSSRERCFNSRTLGRVRRIREVLAIPDILFQFTHPGKGATASASAKFFSTWVSIHAPWEGCDLLVADKSNTFFRFNSRTLGRVRRSAPYQILLSVRFQFTHPGKGATMRHCNVIGCALFQFTHPGKGATVWCCRSADRYLVSIHAPWEGCDPSPWRDLAYTPFGFNSRTLGRVRQSAGKRQYRNYSSFNSRTLGRVRLLVTQSIRPLAMFQFTHPGKGATRAIIVARADSIVSIHAPWEGCDFCAIVIVIVRVSFNSRTLGRVRR